MVMLPKLSRLSHVALTDLEYQRSRHTGFAPERAPVSTLTGTYLATTADSTLLCSGTWTLTLYAAASNSGRTLTIKNIGTGTITVDPDGSETIDGNATVVIDGQYDSMTIRSDGAGWGII